MSGFGEHMDEVVELFGRGSFLWSPLTPSIPYALLSQQEKRESQGSRPGG